MTLIGNFVRFWIEFIIGDSWEVALGIAIAISVLALAAHRWDDQPLLGFVLLATVIALTVLALLRQTASARKG
jgi:hypothetical protein